MGMQIVRSLMLGVLVLGLAGCGKKSSGTQKEGTAAAALTPQALSGDWQDKAGLESQNLEARFTMDGRGGLALHTKSEEFVGKTLYDLTYRIEPGTNTIHLSGDRFIEPGASFVDKKNGATYLITDIKREPTSGSATLISDAEMRLTLGTQQFVLTRTTVKK